MSETADLQTVAEYFRNRSMALETIVEVMLPKMKEMTSAMERALAEVHAIDRRNNVNTSNPMDMMCARVREQMVSTIPQIAEMTNQQLLQYMAQNPEKFKTP